MKNFDISDNLKNDILINLIEPNYKNEIINHLKLRKKFKKYALWLETFSKFFVGVSSVMSFSSGIYKYQIMSFIAGTSSVISLVLLQYSSFSYREYKKISFELNDTLKKLNIITLNMDHGSIADSLENLPQTPKNNI